MPDPAMGASNEVDSSIYILANVNYIKWKRIRGVGRLAVGQVGEPSPYPIMESFPSLEQNTDAI